MGALTPRDPADRILAVMVGASGTPYNTPDIATVDRHIEAVQHRLWRMAMQFPLWASAPWREDLRMLLARRDWMALCEPAEADAEPEGDAR